MIIAIDPGSEESAYCVIDKLTYQISDFGKIKNESVTDILRKHQSANELAIEMIASYGMPVGKEVFETCVWIGRFIEIYKSIGDHYSTVCSDRSISLIYRSQVKMNICHSHKANDSTIRRALIDRFAIHDTKNGKGTKLSKDWFYGFKSDIWQAYAVGVTYIDAERDEKWRL